MGQYHVIANLDLRECLWSDVGLKACEQLNNRPGPCQALFTVLLASNGRGGGDLRAPEPAGERIYGRWAGCRIAVVGDYAEPSDFLTLPTDPCPSQVYFLCAEGIFRDITPLVADILDVECGGIR